MEIDRERTSGIVAAFWLRAGFDGEMAKQIEERLLIFWISTWDVRFQRWCETEKGLLL